MKTQIKSYFAPIVASAFLCLLAIPVHAEPTSLEKAQLKLTLTNFIKNSTTEDGYVFIDPESLERKELQLSKIHPVVFEDKKQGYWLCADFQSQENKKMQLDYYAIKKNDGFIIISVVKGKRSILRKIAEKFGL